MPNPFIKFALLLQLPTPTSGEVDMGAALPPLLHSLAIEGSLHRFVFTFSFVHSL